MRLTPNAPDDRDPAPSPDSAALAFSSTRSGSYQLHILGSTQITDQPSGAVQPSWGTVCSVHPFGDVAAWVDDAVAWAYCNRHMNGFADLTFRGGLDITREQTSRLTCRANADPGTC